MARIMGVNVIGVFLTLLVTAQIAISVRNLVRTQLEETTPPKQSFPFNRAHYVGWGEVLFPLSRSLWWAGKVMLTVLDVIAAAWGASLLVFFVKGMKIEIGPACPPQVKFADALPRQACT